MLQLLEITPNPNNQIRRGWVTRDCILFYGTMANDIRAASLRRPRIQLDMRNHRTLHIGERIFAAVHEDELAKALRLETENFHVNHTHAETVESHHHLTRRIAV